MCRGTCRDKGKLPQVAIAQYYIALWFQNRMQHLSIDREFNACSPLLGLADALQSRGKGMDRVYARSEGTVVHGTPTHVPMVLSVPRAGAEFFSIVWFLCMLQQFQHLWGALCKPLATSDLLV